MRSLLYLLLLSTLYIVLCTSSFAQTKISGKVTDSRGQTIPGANAFIKGSYDGASTDAKGEFSFTSTEQGKQILAISFLGYQTSEQEINLTY